MDNLIQKINKYDLKEIFSVINESNWDYVSIEDLKYIFNISNNMCFKLVTSSEKRIIGCIFCILEDEISYISFFNIIKKKRNFNNAFRLAMACLNKAKNNSKLIVTYANPKLIKSYKRAGFVEDCIISRFLIPKHSSNYINSNTNNVFIMTQNDIEKITVFNKQCLNLPRIKISLEYFNYPNAMCFIHYIERHMYDGYAYLRKFDKDIILGPLVAKSDDTAIILLKYVLAQFPNTNIILNGVKSKLERILNSGNISFMDLKVDVCKMYYKNGFEKENDKNIYCIGGHHVT